MLDALDHLLDTLDAEHTAETLGVLLAGVATSPVAAQPERWASLVTDAPTPAQIEALRGALAAISAALPQEGRALDARLEAVRQVMASRGLDGWIVPRGDAFLGSNVAACDERLRWVSGFTGSAGVAVVLAEEAALFTDGRYTLQAAQQLDASCWSAPGAPSAMMGWLRERLPEGARLGYDPELHTDPWLSRALERLGGRVMLAPCAPGENLIDAAWGEARPPAPIAPVVPHPLRYAGQPAAEKLAQIAAHLVKHERDAVVVATPDLIAWTLNIRGADVPNTPIARARLLVERTGHAHLMLDARKLTPEARAHLTALPLTLHPEATRWHDLLASLPTLRRVQHDPQRSNTAARAALDLLGREAIADADPSLLPRATKHEAEQQGSRDAHVRDAAAVIRWLAWLDAQTPGPTLTEIASQEVLEGMRAEDPLWRGLSYGHISASGPNAAIVHYRATEETNRALQPGELYLVDSGGQYLDATVDLTRTIPIGTPTAEHRARYTQVLQGHIALSRARFPEGTTGGHLDALARGPLWRHGVDFNHGTGHGVGAYLSVHEGPHSISPRALSTPLLPGMLCSNEPGYYKAGEFGIRIENLILVRPCDDPAHERPMLEFETVTLVPYDRRLIDREAMTSDELAWLDAYHARVLDTVGPLLAAHPEALAWLRAAVA